MAVAKERHAIRLDPHDATPQSVRMAVEKMTAANYPKGDCLPCGATIRIGVFFDAFGRSKDEDDPDSGLYSNISRLYDAHRANTDADRPVNQFWFRLYYSGLGTDLNADAKSSEWLNAGIAAIRLVAKNALETTKGVAESVARVNQPIEQLDVKKRVRTAAKQSAAEFSFRPMLNAFNDFKKDIQNIPRTARRIANVLDASPERIWERTKAGGIAVFRNAKSSVKGNPLKIVQSTVRQVITGIAIENVPIVRDSQVMSAYFGTGVDSRLVAAKDQLKKAVETVKSQMPKIRKIEVSVFGADRGCVLARAFVNDLASSYKRRDDQDLALDGIPLEIKFVGLLDAVSSIMSEEAGEIIGIIPFLGTIKPNYKDRSLAVPASVQRCVHFAAAHEMRMYQRLDSLEKTRAEQRLYPGTSSDIVGGSLHGSLGFNAELMRIPLRDMLLEALKAGSALLDMEMLAVRRPDVFSRFSIATPITYEGKQYKIKELVDAYRKIVPDTQGVNFLPHAEVFLRWIAVRYQDPDFRHSVTDPAIEWRRDVEKADYDRRDASAKLDWAMMGSKRMDTPEIRQLKLAKQAADKRYNDLWSNVPPSNYTTVWERLDNEAKEMTSKWEKMRPEYDAQQQRRVAQSFNRKLSYTPLFFAPAFAHHIELNEDQIALVKAWQQAYAGKNPLPPEVMALFDMLVHDTLLTSWQDHVLAPSLYFRTRDKDVFGITHFDEEAKQRANDDRAAARIEQAAKQSQEWARGYKGGATPPVH
ncbi:DUF2235 domain-containing protein [Burkholderia multivorans]|uniref:DUF2235 domain-containing protein n=1 Tax=Burkholderia multivorans TaxID=87883 RepID=UPI00027801E1|nr:DUF2235 domain-containing protein [Burkholderia multivorans]EJO62603.1 PF09994 domain protein [Burkholderia multivorans CF2]MBJ9657388.1 DUF2235 domain-containing protein [Burkholderia multivorans]MBU9283306.1 DUF2235 domain-containing protein [Burkholderia multivorans]MBU9471387.1 DUF2235 domain-containing protein [Burkholderia multivorans]